MSRKELLMKGLADANQWYRSYKSTIQGNQNIERMKKSGITKQNNR